MSDTLETPIPPMPAPLDEIAEREARADAARVTRVFLGFAGVLAVCFVIVLAAMAWKISHPKSPTPLTAATPAAAGGKDAEIALLRAQIAALQGQAAAQGQGQISGQIPGQIPGQSPAVAAVQAPSQIPSQPAPVYDGAQTASLAQLSARMDRLEANQKALARAAGAAYAARSLQLAAQAGDPFLSELAAAEPTIDDPSLATALRPYAEKGVPSEVTLAVRFPAAAARANVAAKAHNGKTGFFDRVAQALAGLISVRRTDDLDGQGTEAILARAENRLDLGDLHGAVGYLTALPPAAHDAMKPWLDQAQARLLVDDTTRRISEKAMNHLSLSSPGAAAPDGGLL